VNQTLINWWIITITVITGIVVIQKVAVEVAEEKEKEVETGKENENEEKAVQENTVVVAVEIIEELTKEMMIIIKDTKNRRIQEELTKNLIRNFVVWKMV
jgi:hypothetical protein